MRYTAFVYSSVQEKQNKSLTLILLEKTWRLNLVLCSDVLFDCTENVQKYQIGDWKTIWANVEWVGFKSNDNEN